MDCGLLLKEGLERMFWANVLGYEGRFWVVFLVWRVGGAEVKEGDAENYTECADMMQQCC